MANIKWTGIEQKKYGLTARWYVSAYYGNDTDVDAVGLYDPSTNATGHGGPTRPFATFDKLYQEYSFGNVVVVDSGYYTFVSPITSIVIVGDGIVTIASDLSSIIKYYNITFVGNRIGVVSEYHDCNIIYSTIESRNMYMYNTVLIESTINGGQNVGIINNSVFINCDGSIGRNSDGLLINAINNFFIDCDDLILCINESRPSGSIIDFSSIIGTIRTNVSINGKTSGVTVEDFKADGNYFLKSYSEVDLFGNTSGSGASVAQINEIFNNYYSPIYIYEWQNADFTLRPTADDRVKFGGLNGTYIGAKPVGYRFSASDLWNTHIDSGNTSNLEYDAINNAIVLTDGFDEGTYRSVRISMPEPITVDLVAFMANFVYNIEGTAKQGVANQRIDTTVDLQPDNTLNQRVVYDYRLQVAPNTTDPLSAFKNYELNREPTIDADGYSQLDDLFDDTTEQKQVVQDFIIEFTLRRVIID